MPGFAATIISRLPQAMKLDKAFLFRHPAHFVALGMGAGLAARAPGTWGTLVAFPIFFAANSAGETLMLALSAATFVLGWWASSVTGKALGVADHGGIVIDEIAAFLLVLTLAPQGAGWWMAAFIAFRFFDIVKPWPIGLADRNLKGGFGVMFDDLLAAGYAIAVLWIFKTAIS